MYAQNDGISRIPPDSTPNRMIFRLNEKTQKYNVYPGNIKHLSERTGMSEADFNQFFDEIQKHADEFNKQFKFVRSCCFFILFMTCFILFPLYAFMYCYIQKVIKKTSQESAKAREAMKKIADVQNEILSTKGFMWVIPEQCPRWVEFWDTDPSKQVQGPRNGLEAINQAVAGGHFDKFVARAEGKEYSNQYYGESQAQPQQPGSQHYEA